MILIHSFAMLFDLSYHSCAAAVLQDIDPKRKTKCEIIVKKAEYFI